MNAVTPKWPQVKYAQTQLGGGTNAQGVSYPGGLDLTTPSLRLQAGALRDGLNFECAQSGGYARTEGYERVDGHPVPSSAQYRIIQLASMPNVPTIGQIATQAVTAATGYIIAVNPTPPYYIAVIPIGTFDETHALTTPGPVAIGTATTLTTSLDAKTRAQYKAAAADVYRLVINAVPGSGNVLGAVGMVFSGVDNIYAFRANGGGTAVLLYKATSSGWVLVPYYNIISFTAGGTATPLDGDNLTQGGVHAIIKRVMWQSGTWTGTAVGQFVVVNPTGGNFAAGAATAVGSGATVTLSGVQTPITMAPGGRFEFEKCNFSGQLETRRIYGCDGVNKLFEFDGDTLAPITTGLSPDAPSHIRFHKNYLVASQGSSILGCGAGTPFKWSSVDGAWEIATGDQVNAMITLPGSQTTATMAVLMRGNSGFLYGTDPTTFNFVMFNAGIGCLPYSAQNLFDTFFLDALGVVTLKTTLNWGNFLPTTLTKNILPFIAQERTKLTASSIHREKSQYRLFFRDGYALYCTVINQQYLGAIPQYFPNPVLVCDETSLADGTEATYFGSTDGLGYVYQLDKGTSFDGTDIDAYITTAWDPIKSPRILKRFRAASIEVQGDGYAEINYGYQIGYGNTQYEQVPGVDAALSLSQLAHWDSFTWDQFVWDGTNLMPTDVDETGTAENIQITISSGSNYMPSYTLNSVIHHYSMRRGMRV